MCDHKNLTYTDAKHVNPRVLRPNLNQTKYMAHDGIMSLEQTTLAAMHPVDLQHSRRHQNFSMQRDTIQLQRKQSKRYMLLIIQIVTRMRTFLWTDRDRYPYFLLFDNIKILLRLYHSGRQICKKDGITLMITNQSQQDGITLVI